MPPVTEGYVKIDEGACSLTGDITSGSFVRSPYIVTEQYIGRPFMLSSPVIIAFATALGLVEEAPLLDQLDQREQTILDLNETVIEMEQELKEARPIVQRYYIERGQEDGTDFETQIAELNATVSNLKAQLSKYNAEAREQNKKEKAAA